VLNDAIRAGGTTLRDYVNSDGMPGYFRQKLFVYERAANRAASAKRRSSNCATDNARRTTAQSARCRGAIYRAVLHLE